MAEVGGKDHFHILCHLLASGCQERCAGLVRKESCDHLVMSAWIRE
jgi:hypothetical protein